MSLVLAMILDAVMGEPRWLWSRLPHPAVMMGRLIGWADQRFNAGPSQKRNGVLLTLGLVLGFALLGWVLAQLGWVAEVLIAAVLLAHRSLVDHVAAVAQGLRMSVAQGRRDVAMIVGRDTTDMTAPDVARAAIESGAENFSDGVIAPAFWFLLAGLPGILVYKAVNTADSMIGYRTPRHQDFGWAAARLDDVLNWIPARLTALILAVAQGKITGWGAIAADARKHRSPNAGWPEAVLSRGLGIAVSGPRTYDGVRQDLPWVNAAGRKDAAAPDIDRAVTTLWWAWAVFGGLTLGWAVLLRLPLLG